MKTFFALTTGLLVGTGFGIFVGATIIVWVENETGIITKKLQEQRNEETN